MDRTLAIRSLAVAFAIGAIAQALFVGAGLGLNAVLLVVFVLAAAAIVHDGSARIDPIDLWIPVAALLVAGMLAIRSDPTLVFLDTVTALTLVGASMAVMAGVPITRKGAAAITAAGTIVLGWTLVGILRVVPATRRPERGPGWRSHVPPVAVPVIRGLVIALPILFVFTLLFSAADAVFASITERLFDWRFDVGQLPERIALGFGVAWVVAGLLGVAIGGATLERPEPAPAWQSLGAAAVTRPVSTFGRLGATEALTILVAVDALFGAFVVLQVAYLFGGLDTLAAGGITYANYARRGFFELVAVVCLSGGLVVGLHALVAERTRLFVAGAIALALLTFVILGSAALRLSLYQDAYGWTELRFYIDATIAWLGMGIVAAVVLLARDRMGWLVHAMTMSAVGILIAVNVIGSQRFVAESNVARLLDPALVPADGQPGLDLWYVLGLGDDAVPALVAALPAMPEGDRALLMEALEARWLELNQPEAMSWAGWNLARERAREALATVFGR